MGLLIRSNRFEDKETYVDADIESWVSRSTKESGINPVLRAYETGGELLGCCPGIIYNGEDRVLVYYDNVFTREVMLLFLIPLSLLLHKIVRSRD